MPGSVLNEETCEITYDAVNPGWYAGNLIIIFFYSRHEGFILSGELNEYFLKVSLQLEDYVSSTLAGPLSSAPGSLFKAFHKS